MDAKGVIIQNHGMLEIMHNTTVYLKGQLRGVKPLSIFQ